MKNTVLHCNFCGSEKSSRLYKDNPHLVICDECSLVYTNAQMSVEGMKGFYDDEYFVSKDSIQKGYEHYFDGKMNISKTFLKRMDIIEHYCKKPGRLLDIGCAAGFFLEVARNRGWDVHGIDISKLCATYARDKMDIDVKIDLFMNAVYEDSSFDLITMWDYLEHSITPKEDIEKAWKLLRKGGLLVLATPDILSIPARICKSRWIGIKLEEHFYYFTRDVLSKLLSETGFEVLRMNYIGKYISSSMAANRLVFYNKLLSRTLGALLKRVRFSFYCNPLDIMFIIAKKV
jgi:2-polyprenyl-3-methyl-5-hydroxy-6-metoxy-1,4-benzoquinol methylase